ncbi:hypothetical protein A2U01_0089921, partial [Trifolium medium]|nr:hypothetical protein [Trifolium medium]
ELQMDAQGVINALNKELAIQAEGWSLCKRIWRIMELEWELRIRHTYCEANLCADTIAHIRCDLDSNVIIC